MRVTNGWNIDRDDLGFWLVRGTVREGPFTTPDHARAYGRIHPAPAIVKPPRRKPDDERT